MAITLTNKPLMLQVSVIVFLLVTQAESQCQACVDIFGCKICYDNCTSMQSTSSFKKCYTTFCSFTTTSGLCLKYQTINYNSSQCLGTCCYHSAEFTIQELETCKSRHFKFNTIPLIIILSIVGFGVLIVVIWCCYLSKRKKSSPQRNTGQQDGQVQQTGTLFKYASAQHIAEQNQHKNISVQSWQQSQSPNTHISNQNNDCAVCQSVYVNTMTQCGHCFHFDCIFEWLKRNPRCPLCNSEDGKYVKFYCTKCFMRYVPVNLRSVGDHNNFLSSIKGPNCRQCQQ